MADVTQVATLEGLLADGPNNWSRWGPDDEIGALNFLTSEEVRRGVREVSSGEVFTLGAPVGSPGGDPVWPGRSGAVKLMRNLGVLFSEVCWLEELADSCATDGRYTFLYAAAPLNIVGGTGAPVNPVAI